MQCNSIWTTNFDQVLENNLNKLGKITNVISKQSDLISNDLNKNINIFKLNGDIRDIQNAVITKGDLEKYGDDHDYFLAFFKRELITKTFLFLGYSFTDSLVLPCVSELGRAFKNNQPHHYTIIKKSNCSDFQSFIKDLEGFTYYSIFFALIIFAKRTMMKYKIITMIFIYTCTNLIIVKLTIVIISVSN